MCKKRRLICFLLPLVMLLTGCAAANNEPEKPAESELPFDAALPDTIRTDEKGIPVMDVYITGEERVEEMDIETYLCGVLAGEMKNDWPMEALKAQAILARTFVIKFLSEKQSKYENADISTDVEEAQAYKKLLTEFNLKQDEVAERVSKSRAAVTNSIRLLKLSDKVQQMVIDDMISTGHARALLAVGDADEQYNLARNDIICQPDIAYLVSVTANDGDFITI